MKLEPTDSEATEIQAPINIRKADKVRRFSWEIKYAMFAMQSTRPVPGADNCH